jgi:hypothetical protein
MVIHQSDASVFLLDGFRRLGCFGHGIPFLKPRLVAVLSFEAASGVLAPSF